MLLALIGVGIAFAFVGFVANSPFKDIWIHQEPEEELPYWKITEDQRQTAIEIAKQNETVKQYFGQGYEISRVSPTFGNETGIIAAEVFLTKGDSKVSLLKGVSVYVNLNTEEVTGIDEGPKDFRLTEKQEEKAKQIALSDPEVKKMLDGVDYEIKVGPLLEKRLYEIPVAEGVSKMGSTEELIGASVKFKFTDGTIVSAHVSLEKEEVIRISPLMPSH